MKCWILASCLLVVATTASLAQRRPGRGLPTAPPPPGVNPNSSGSIFLTGKVVIEDGSELAEPVAIQSVCRGHKHTEGYTDSHGGFSFEIGRTINSNSAGLSDADTDWNSISSRARDLQECDLQAALAGFTSDSIPLASKISMGQSNDVGHIVLHRLEKVDGLTISATSAAAPKAARKAYEKGRAEEAKQKWDQAEESFQKAVAIYPRYAVAWCELGRVQQEKNDGAGARTSYNQSIAADPQYVNPYRGLAQISAVERKWAELVAVTTKLLALNPVTFPDAWFFNALGHYNQHSFEPAEKSARQGIRIDVDHHIPKLELLLGDILAHRQQYSAAADHLRLFLQLQPSAPESDLVRRQLTEILQLAAARPQTP